MHKKAIIFTIGIIITGTFLLLAGDTIFKYFGTLTKINHIFYDANLKIFHKKIKSDRVAIVDIDENSLIAEGRWPWSRNKIATIVKTLQKSGAAVIVFDILFPEPEPNIANTLLQYAKQNNNAPPKALNYLKQQLTHFNNDKILATTLAKTDAVLGVLFDNDSHHTVGKLGKPLLTLNNSINLMLLRSTNFIGNIPSLADAVHYTGFTTTTPDIDGTIRRSPLLIEYNNALYPALALEAVRAYLLTEKFSLDLHDVGVTKVLLGIKVGNIYIPTDKTGNIIITYYGPAFSFPYISAIDVINNNFPPQFFAGKIVLLGSSIIGIGDVHATTLQAIGYPGIEIHASIIESILNNDIISSPLWLLGLERILIVVTGSIFTILALNSPLLSLLLLTITLLLLIFGFNILLLLQWHWILPHPILLYLQTLSLGIAYSAYGYFFEAKTRKKLHTIYGQYVSSAHIDKMLQLHNKPVLTGTTKVMTVLFADICNFTSIAEKLNAKEVKKFLNSCFTPLTQIIFECKGTIDKYVGDMIMAFWNDPITDSQHAYHGVQAALLMQDKIKKLAPTFAQQKLGEISIRIGINTGTMHVGDMGSKYRKAYTVLGDAVNLASRLESVNKTYKTGILVSQETKDKCPEIVFRFIDNIYVTGKTISTKIYEPICLLNNKTSALITELSRYEQALTLYNAGDWSAAKKEFSKLVEQYPQIFPYTIYLQRAHQKSLE